MQKFSKKQIALAVSASLLAGSALAANGVPAPRSATPLVVTAQGAGTPADLYATAGYTGGTLTFKAFLDSGAGATADGVTGDATGTAGVLQVAGGVASGALVTTDATLANNHVVVYTGADAATGAKLSVTSAVLGDTTDGVAAVTVVLANPGAGKGFRINAGKLEYSADTTDATKWAVVKVDIRSVATKEIYAEEGTAAGFIAANDFELTTTGITGQEVKTSLIPALKSVKTRATAGLVDGITFETYSPLSGLANDDVDVGTVAQGGVTKTAALTAGWTAQAKAGATNTYEVFFATPASIDWTAGDATADTAAYSSALFNTGVVGAGLPFSVVNTATAANQTAYTEIFDEATGAAVKFATGLAASAATDGAAPVLKAAEYQAAAGSLVLTLSEPLAFIGGGAADANDIRKVLENVTLDGTKLAADYQLRSAAANASIANDATKKTAALTITGLGASRTNVEGKAVAVLPTIALQDAYVGNTEANLDTAGVGSVTGAAEGAAGSVTATLNNTVAWADSTARGYYATGDLTKIDNIVVDFGKALSVKAGKSLDKAFKVTFTAVSALENGPGYTFNWFPAASEVTVTGNTIKFTLPTDLLRSNLRDLGDGIGDTSVTYNGGTDLPLQANINAGTKVDVASGTEHVILPLTATSAAQGLYTMDVKADLKAPAGSKVVAYLAKWVDNATAAAASTSVLSGKVSIPGDKWATDVALTLAGGAGGVGDVETAVDTQLKATKPAAVPAWIVVNRSNDLVKGGSNNGNTNENYLVASATLYGDAATATAAAVANQSTVFEVAVDPKTGNISGRLTGNLKLKNTAGNTNERGLVFISTSGSLVNTAAGAAQSQALVDATGKARFLIGAGPKKDLKDAGAVFKDAFVLLVGETQADDGSIGYKLLTSAEPSMSNFLPFSSNLVAGNDALGTVTLDVANIKTASLANSTSWQLVGAGNLDRSAKAAAAISLPRLLVGLNGSTPTSFWSNDTAATDIGLTLLGNKSGVAVEAADKDVNTVASGSNTKANAFAFAFANDVAAANNKLFFLTKTAEAPALPVGWALVAANATSLPSDVSMALFAGSNHVGIGSSWATGDTAATLTVGQPLFVYAKKAIAGK